jgi:antitoxin component of RelBE/YafQ-DinJ toxin-antitoxin module
MSTYQIQMPIEQNIKTKAEEKAKTLGLKGINDTIRFLLTNFAHDRVNINISLDDEIERYKKELDQEVAETLRKQKISGKKGYSNVKDLMKALNS